MVNRNRALLFVGSYLSSNAEKKVSNISLSESLSMQLAQIGWTTLLTSRKINPLFRLTNIARDILCKRHDYDLVLIDLYSGRAFLLGEISATLLRMLKKNHVIILHGGNLPEYSKQHKKRISRLFNGSDHIVAPSKYMQIQMAKFDKEIQIIPNSIEVTRYPYKHRELVDPHLVWLRAFHKIYNPTLAPKVISRLIKEFSEIILTMVGPDKKDGSYIQTLEAAKNLDVLSRIELPGKVSNDDVPNWLNKGDIFINTTNFDNTPVSVIEAMACGLCIVSTDVGGIPYLMEDEVDALLVPPDDPDAMAGAVRRILTDPDLAARLSANARKKAESFSWERVLPMWERLINDVLENNETQKN